MKPTKPYYGAVRAAEAAGLEQPLNDREKALVREAYERLEVFRDGCREMHDRAREARRIALADDPRQDLPGTPAERRTLQLQTLRSTLNNCVADQMDNMPEATLTPEREALAQTAEDLTDIVRFVLERNHYEALHRRRVEDCFITGTAVTQVTWDEEMDGGKGNVALLRWPIEAFLWDPVAEDIQDARALMKVSWHPLSWYKAHYPEAAPYVADEAYAHEEVGVPDAWQQRQAADEGRAMMLEYWYRLYDADARRYRVHVALMAGGALLEMSEKDSPEGVFAHGLYPFVVDVYTPIEGLPVGNGMMQEFAPMMRYINRYAHYIDENLRMAAKTRLLVRRDAQIDHMALTDWQQNIIEGGNIDEDAVRWMTSQPLGGLATGQMLQMQNDVKQDSGQNQFSRGEPIGGVTAASAIASLQEAGGKITRLHTEALNQGFKQLVEQVAWLVSEFYGQGRAERVTGRDGSAREIIWAGRGGAFPPPPCNVRVEVQRRNPVRVQARNELYFQAFELAARMGTPMPVSALFELLDADGKERALAVIRRLEAQPQPQKGAM
ncbi:MAG: hypothetical protein LBM74_08790 [Oscillospiraceae bacterium]|jgi:hypothetical protein|nr:hypothetical protein [Oscillospiraceae bacterium]